MSLQQFCKRPVVTISPNQTILEACQLLREKKIGCLVVEEGGQLYGIITDRDIALRVTGAEKDPRQTQVRNLMTPNPTHIAVDKNLRELTTLMHTRHVRRVPIVDSSNKVLGIVTLDDLLALLSQEISDLSEGIGSSLFPKPAREPEATSVFDWSTYYL